MKSMKMKKFLIWGISVFAWFFAMLYVHAEVIGIISVDQLGTPINAESNNPSINWDGSKTAFVSDNIIYLYNDETKTSDAIDTASDDRNWVSISPNSQYIAYVKDGEIHTYDTIKQEYSPWTIGQMAEWELQANRYYADQACDRNQQNESHPVITDQGIVIFSVGSTCVFTYDTEQNSLTYIGYGNTPWIDQLTSRYIVYQEDEYTIAYVSPVIGRGTFVWSDPQVAENGFVSFNKDWNVKLFNMDSENMFGMSIAGQNQNISADGKFVVFSTHENLDPTNDNMRREQSDVYVYNIETEQYALVNIKDWDQGSSDIWDHATIAISANGGYISMHGHDNNWFDQQKTLGQVFYANNPFVSFDSKDKPIVLTPYIDSAFYGHTVSITGRGILGKEIRICNARNECLEPFVISDKEGNWQRELELEYGYYEYKVCYVDSKWDTWGGKFGPWEKVSAECDSHDPLITTNVSFYVSQAPSFTIPASDYSVINNSYFTLAGNVSRDFQSQIYVFDESNNFVCNVTPSETDVFDENLNLLLPSWECWLNKVSEGEHTYTICTADVANDYSNQNGEFSCPPDDLVTTSVIHITVDTDNNESWTGDGENIHSAPVILSPSEDDEVINTHKVSIAWQGTPWKTVYLCTNQQCSNEISETDSNGEREFHQELSDGNYIFNVCYEVDLVSNLCPENNELTSSIQFNVDTTYAPSITMPPMNGIVYDSDTVVFKWEGMPGYSIFIYDISGRMLSKYVPINDNGTWEYKIGGLAEGLHSIRVCYADSSCDDLRQNSSPYRSFIIQIAKRQENVWFAAWSISAISVATEKSLDVIPVITITKVNSEDVAKASELAKIAEAKKSAEVAKAYEVTKAAEVAKVTWASKAETKIDIKTTTTTTVKTAAIVAALENKVLTSPLTPTLTITDNISNEGKTIKNQDATKIPETPKVDIPSKTENTPVVNVDNQESPVTTIASMNAEPIIFPTEKILNPTMQEKTCVAYDKNILLYDEAVNLTPEYKEALYFARLFDLTDKEGTMAYRPYDYISRQEAAKLFTLFAKKVLCREAILKYNDNFSDITTADPTLVPYIKQAYELGIFKWWEAGNFKPKALLSKKETLAILMRLLTREIKSEESSISWFRPYKDSAISAGLLTNSSPLEGSFTRSYIIQKLYAAYKHLPFTLDNDWYVFRQ